MHVPLGLDWGFLRTGATCMYIQGGGYGGALVFRCGHRAPCAQRTLCWGFPDPDPTLNPPHPAIEPHEIKHERLTSLVAVTFCGVQCSRQYELYVVWRKMMKIRSLFSQPLLDREPPRKRKVGGAQQQWAHLPRS